jgi:hypothetical protein
MPRRVWVLCLVLPLAVFAVPARADLVISIQDTSVAQGGTGTVDVYLTSNAPIGTPDMINSYGFQLQITNNGVDGTQLAFSTNQDFGYVSATTSPNPPYVFLNDSNAAQSSPPFIGGPPTQTMYPNDTFTGTDFTFSNNPVSLSAGTTYLLASLTVTTATGAPPMASDSFTVSLVPPSGTGSVFAGNTFFDNFDYNSGSEISATPFTSTSGTVTITPASIPEPASIISGLTAVLLLAGWHGARRLRRSDRGACLRG